MCIPNYKCIKHPRTNYSCWTCENMSLSNHFVDNTHIFYTIGEEWLEVGTESCVGTISWISLLIAYTTHLHLQQLHGNSRSLNWLRSYTLVTFEAPSDSHHSWRIYSTASVRYPAVELWLNIPISYTDQNCPDSETNPCHALTLLSATQHRNNYKLSKCLLNTLNRHCVEMEPSVSLCTCPTHQSGTFPLRTQGKAPSCHTLSTV